MMAAYYNEIEPAAAHVLRCLIEDGVIAPGDVDDRSIKDVRPEDIQGYTQCHFFAGGGLWSVAARLAGWPDDRPIWTGSCPCQGESLAGRRLGAADPRHLWPDLRRLIRAARPPVVVGEQVAAAASTHWLDGALSDLDADNYAARAVSIPACSVDAPHQRGRIYWVAVSGNVDDGERAGLEGYAGHGDTDGRWPHPAGSIAASDGGAQSNADSCGRSGGAEGAQRGEIGGAAVERSIGELFTDASSVGWGKGGAKPIIRGGRHTPADDHLSNGSFWSDAEWIISPIDGKARRSKPGIRFLVDGLPGRVDLWRVGGNAIVPQVAAEVLRALMETL